MQPQARAGQNAGRTAAGQNMGRAAAGQAAGEAAKAAGKAAGGGLMKVAAVAAAGAIAVGAVSAITGGGGSGGGSGSGGSGGGSRPPVVSTQGYGGNQGGSSGKSGSGSGSGKSGGSGSAQASGNYQYFLWQTYEYEDGGDFSVDDVVVRVDFDEAAGKMYLYPVGSDGDYDEDDALVLDYNPSSGTASMSLSEDDAHAELHIRKNADGSLSGTISGADDESEGTTYTKLTGLSGGPDSFKVSTTGENASWSDLSYGDAEMAHNLFIAEAQHYIIENGLSYRIKDGGSSPTTSYNPPAYRPPSPGKVDPPQDVLEYYVKVEAQNRVREKATGQPQTHVTLPSNWNISQSEFDAMVAEEMKGEIMGQ